SLLQDYANQAISNYVNQRESRFSFHLKTDLPLPVFDCFLAPCVAACPIHQDVPQYIRLLEEERYTEALSLIFQRNPLPNVTGSICDHQCMYKCVRNDYECPLQIRDLKYLAARKGQNDLLSQLDQNPEAENSRVAIVGAGPAGLAAASFLARNGFRVKVFEKKAEAGGMVRYVIPSFRLDQEALDQDLALLEVLGVEFEFNCNPDLTVEKLRLQGFEYIILAIGAWHSRPFNIECSDGRMVNAIEFLQEFNRAPSRLQPGKQVVVVGGGNSAMDGARAARLLPGVEEVSIVYRRTVQEMPADREEYLAALADGVKFRELLLPISFQKGKVTCQKMALGEPDASGRKHPEPLPEFQDIQADLLITAIGEQTDYEYLENLGIQKITRDNFHIDAETYETNLPGVFLAGDALHGPATVVQAIADAWQVAKTIIERENIKLSTNFSADYPINPQDYRQDITLRKAVLKQCINEDKLIGPGEAKRCLGCDLICNKCVEVCPNRANITIRVKSDLLEDYNQILHLDGLCNECGNCETFCPYQGAPYKDKITLFWLAEDFHESLNNGFYFENVSKDITVKLRWQNQLFTLYFSPDGTLKNPDLSLMDQDKIVRFIWTIFEDYNYLLFNGNR
ncbi:MAG: FAD-dependent oxidoreductase, partial [Candidatus Cloacimonetes bacterium]|nr:FAD-dependent oxidoreductase [Candidatus Cloacimonadota bacterium]